MDTLAPPVPPTRRSRVTLWMLRLSLVMLLPAVLVQPVLAGRYLIGDVDAMAVHGLVGSLLALAAMVVIAAALAYVVVVRGRLWVVLAAVLLFLAVGMQIGFGYSRELNLHVPLGVAITVGSVLLTAWSWTPAAARPRGGR